MSSQRLKALIHPSQANKDHIILSAPDVGYWLHGPQEGQIIKAGEPIGYIERLGVRLRVEVPNGQAGVVIKVHGDGLARQPVGWDSPLLTLSTADSLGMADSSGISSASTDPNASGLIFPTPMGGRYYNRPRPSEPPFVSVGSVIEEGQTVALIEVMKTFNRVNYNPSEHSLPVRARIRAILAQEDADVTLGQPLLELEPAE